MGQNDGARAVGVDRAPLTRSDGVSPSRSKITHRVGVSRSRWRRFLCGLIGEHEPLPGSHPVICARCGRPFDPDEQDDDKAFMQTFSM